MFTKFLSDLSQTAIKISGVRIHQTQSTEIKNNAVDSLVDLLENAGASVSRTRKGAVVSVKTKTGRTVHLEIDAIVKNDNFDLNSEIAEYNEWLANKQEKELARAEKAKENEKLRQEKIELAKAKKEREKSGE